MSSLCETVSADLLLTATAPEIKVGSGPAQFALAGAFREGAIVLLDKDGLPLGYVGDPVEWASALTACPGGSTVVQSTDTEITITALATGDQQRFSFADDEFITSTFCDDPTGSDVRLITERWVGERPRHRLWTATPEPSILGELPTVSDGQATLAAETVVIVEQDNRGARVKVFDPATGFTEIVTETVRGANDTVAFYDRPAISSDGRRMVVNELRYGSEGDRAVESRVIVFDTTTAEILTERDRRSTVRSGPRPTAVLRC